VGNGLSDECSGFNHWPRMLVFAANQVNEEVSIAGYPITSSPESLFLQGELRLVR
jgi:hypothetical protein